MLIDTDVFIWFLRGNKKALTVIESVAEICLSAITYMELVQGTRNKKELANLDRLLVTLNATIIPIDQSISDKATHTVKTLYHSHSVELADALIGMTAVVHQKPLLTANQKHFQPIKNLEVQTFKP